MPGHSFAYQLVDRARTEEYERDEDKSAAFGVGKVIQVLALGSNLGTQHGAGHEGGDEPTTPENLDRRERPEGESHRSDLLMKLVHPPAFSGAADRPCPGEADHHSSSHSNSNLSDDEKNRRGDRPAGFGLDQADGDEQRREGETIVQPRLDVQRLANPHREHLRLQHWLGKGGIGWRQDHTQ